MKNVSADIIDAVIEQLEAYDDDQYEQEMEKFADEQPVVFSYLFSEQFSLLSEDEQGYLHYLALIAYKAIQQAGNGTPLAEISEEQIGEAEEKNYEILENSPGENFQDRLEPFFEDYEQEDLLAFAEEAILEEEDEAEAIVTNEGREPIFIALKTMIDVLTK